MPTIKELRKAEQMTQKELALELGVTIETVRSWEQSRSSPGIRYRILICSFYGVKPAEVDWPGED